MSAQYFCGLRIGCFFGIKMFISACWNLFVVPACNCLAPGLEVCNLNSYKGLWAKAAGLCTCRIMSCTSHM